MTGFSLERRVIVADCRKLGYCVSGLKTFAKQNGLDFKELLRAGWPIDRLKQLDDLYADAAVSVALERMNGQ